MKRYSILFILILFSFINAVAQVKVTGLIKDDTGEPLIGANVIISGTTNGTITDIDGKFEIDVPSKDVELSFSFIGYIEQKILVGEQTNIDVVLETDAEQIEEVVILGYGVVKKSNVIGAISSVGSEEIKDRPVSDAMQALQGQTSGVSITQNSGAPGEGAKINIRGIGTVNNSEPLYVVDGIITSGIGHISPNDIESVEILKDAASAAIYGAQGANGVVIVNTKSAKSGEFKVHADYYLGAQQYWNSVEVMDRYDWQVYEHIRKNNSSGLSNHLKKTKEEYFQINPDVNWIDEISQTGILQRGTLSIMQGTDKLDYYLSAGLFDQKGLIKSSDNNKYNILLKVTARPHKRVTLQLKSAFQGAKTNKVASGENSLLRDALISPPGDIYDKEDGYLLDTPVRKIEQSYNKAESKRFDLNGDLKINIIDGLYFQSRIGIEYKTGFTDNYGYVGSQFDYKLYEPLDPKKPSITNKLTQNQQVLWENIINYNKTIRKHDIGILVFSSMDDHSGNNVEGKGNSFLYNNTNFSVPDLIGDKKEPKGDKSHTRGVGFGGRLNYSYNNKYLLEFNFRGDASSTFPEDERWGFFPSISLGWRLDQEKFMSGLEWISQLKIDRKSVV